MTERLADGLQISRPSSLDGGNMSSASETSRALSVLVEALLTGQGSPEGERWMTLKEAAAYVGVKDEATLRGWIATGELRYGRAGREFRLRRSDLDAYLFRHEHQSVRSAEEPQERGEDWEPDPNFHMAQSILQEVG